MGKKAIVGLDIEILENILGVHFYLLGIPGSQIIQADILPGLD